VNLTVGGVASEANVTDIHEALHFSGGGDDGEDDPCAFLLVASCLPLLLLSCTCALLCWVLLCGALYACTISAQQHLQLWLASRGWPDELSER
jgi:hypothetical protein